MKPWRKPFDHQDKTFSSPNIYINRERCKGCGYCVEFCPQKALSMSSEFNSKGYNPAIASNEQDCMACGYCEAICPEFAIKIVSSISSEDTATSKLKDKDKHKEKITN